MLFTSAQQGPNTTGEEVVPITSSLHYEKLHLPIFYYYYYYFGLFYACHKAIKGKGALLE